MEHGVRAIICDLDFTLVFQTREYFATVVGGTLKRFGFAYDDDFARRFWLEGNRDELIERTFGVPYMEFWKVFWELDRPDVRTRFTEAYPDVVALRDLLRERKILLGIVTNAQGVVARAEIAKLQREVPGLEVRSVVANVRDNSKYQKPSVVPLLKCMDQLGVRPEEVVYIGDNAEDVEMTRKAGVRMVLVRRHGNGNIRFSSHFVAIDSLDELEKIIL